MRIGIVYCKNCGAKYNWQASGNYWALDTPQEYNDSEYCPECKKAIIDALALIEKKSIIKWIKTNEVNLETLKWWEEENIRERKLLEGNPGHLLPHMKRVFATLPEHDTIHIQGREEYSHKFFHCEYNRNTNELLSLTIKVRVDLSDKILEYINRD